MSKISRNFLNHQTHYVRSCQFSALAQIGLVPLLPSGSVLICTSWKSLQKFYKFQPLKLTEQKTAMYNVGKTSRHRAFSPEHQGANSAWSARCNTYTNFLWIVKRLRVACSRGCKWHSQSLPNYSQHSTWFPRIKRRSSNLIRKELEFNFIASKAFASCIISHLGGGMASAQAPGSSARSKGVTQQQIYQRFSLVQLYQCSYTHNDTSSTHKV